MPINTNLNTAPYFDDYDLTDQYYRVLFKPGYAVQARELTQLQTILQNQVEQFGDNIFKEGSIVKGCNFTRINALKFVKVDSADDFNPSKYIPKQATEVINGVDTLIDYVYELVGEETGLTAQIISAADGFESRPPDLNTFFIRYTNESTIAVNGQFTAGENLTINLYRYKVGELTGGETNPLTGPVEQDAAIVKNVYSGALTPEVGSSYGIESAPGIIFQKGHFLFADAQTLIVSKYSDLPDQVSVGYRIRERLINSRQDANLYDNANGSNNDNAPGADRLKLIPELVALSESVAAADATFFSLVRYSAGNAVSLRDVSQYNVIGEEMARRTYEESGNYILKDFKLKAERKENTANTSIEELRVTLGTGTGYVKGFRVETKGEESFVIDDILTTDILQNQPVSFNYGGWYKCTFQGRPLITMGQLVTLRNVSNANIGQAYITNVVGNSTFGKVFLTGISMSSGKVTDVENILLSGGLGEITIDPTIGFVAQEHQRSELVFDSGLMSCKETTDTTVAARIKSTVAAVEASTGSFTLTATGSDNFAGANAASEILVVGTNSVVYNVNSITVTNGGSELNIVLATPSAGDVDVYYNKNLNLTSSGPYNKQERTTWIATTFNGTKNRYSLGLPDCYELIEVLDAAGDDYTKSFQLMSNQLDTFYDHSFIEYIAGRPKPANGVITIKFKVFQINAATGEYFFTINSYPAAMDSNEIPTFTASSGKRYNLRECFDFRPYQDKSASVEYNTASAAAAVSAGVYDATVGSLGEYGPFADYGDPIIPAYKGFATTDIEHYLSRVDLVVIDSYGVPQLIKGEEERFATAPKAGPESLVIGEITVPGVPALTMQEANSIGKRDYAIKAKAKGITNYTMKDLHSLEKKIDNMAYYISLNQLESDTVNLTVRDASGLTRFKNGFVADPMNDLGIADIKNPEFDAAIKFKQKILTPSVKQFSLDLIYAAGANTQVYPSITLPKVGSLGKNADISLLNQPYATAFRNCVSNFYNFAGRGQLSPPYDANYDTVTNPVQIEIDVDFPVQEIIDNIQQIQPLTDTEVSTSGVNAVTGGGTESTTTRSLELVGNTTTKESQYVGDFVTNQEFEPFMAGRDIKIYMVGLRPSARHYFFFDKVKVDSYIVPGSLDADSAEAVRRSGSLGGAVTADANGVLRAVFTLPPETFFVGDRILEISDVDTYSSIESGSTSGGFATYRAYNFSVEKSALTTTTTTRTPDFEISETTTTRNLPNRPAPAPRPVFPVFRRGDPLAQTFFIKGGMGQGSDSVYVSKIDVFFKRKSNTNGVTVMLREVFNGYPAPEVLPFSSIHLKASEVNVSDDASAVTTVIFEGPVRLDTEKEYCVVVMPDANDPGYLIFTSKVGGTDLSPGLTQGQSVVQDWGDGILFTSTNNRAWKSYQDEDIKFNLYRSNFDQSAGTITMTNNNHEFLTVNTITGAFNQGEEIYQIKSRSGATAQSVSILEGTNLITGNALDDTYAAGDSIILVKNGLRDIFKIVSMNSSTEMTVDHQSSRTITNGNGNPVMVGNLCYYDPRNVREMYLEGSNATSTRTFVAGAAAADKIYGMDSESEANIVSIDNVELSYVLPFISRSNDSKTKTTITGEFVDPLDTNTTTVIPMKFNDQNNFNKAGCLLYSHSNNANKSKKFEITVNMVNSGNVTSTPMIDIEVSKLMANVYNVTDDQDTTSKYVSKTIELADDFDAEDFQVLLTGYRPEGTDIRVYFRGQNPADQTPFTNLTWVEMELLEGQGVFSSTGNQRDYREFKFGIPSSEIGSEGFQYTSPVGTFDTFRRFSVKIVMSSARKGLVPTVKDYRGIAIS